jgi:hypothetical protein
MAAKMSKAAVMGLATVLICGLGAGAAEAKAKKLPTKLEVEGTEFQEMSDALTFLGDVHAKKNKCERNREVTLRNTDPDPGADALHGPVTTDHTGDWEIDVDFEDLNLGPYIAEVSRKKVGQGDKRIVCKAAESEPFELTVL